MKYIRLTEGALVKRKGTSRVGKVIKIQRDPELVEWHGNSPLFIQVEFDGDITFYTPKQLKRVTE